MKGEREAFYPEMKSVSRREREREREVILFRGRYSECDAERIRASRRELLIAEYLLPSFHPPDRHGRPVYGASGDFNFFTPSGRRDGAFARATGDSAHSICISTRASISLNPLAAFKPLRISSVCALSSSARLPRPPGGQGISLRSCRICIRELSNSRPTDSVTLINSRAASKGSRTARRGLHNAFKSGFTGAKSAFVGPIPRRSIPRKCIPPINAYSINGRARRFTRDFHFNCGTGTPPLITAPCLL